MIGEPTMPKNETLKLEEGGHYKVSEIGSDKVIMIPGRNGYFYLYGNKIYELVPSEKGGLERKVFGLEGQEEIDLDETVEYVGTHTEVNKRFKSEEV